jgi:hypothetical protein
MMSHAFTIGLMAIFILHFLVILHLYVRHRRNYYVFLMISFVLLTFYVAMRIWWHDLMLFGHFAHTYLRIAAWVFTGLGLLLYLRFRLICARQP